MKKLLSLVVVLLFSLFMFVGCQKDNKPSCEEHNTGFVTVVNNTGSRIVVDVTWGSSENNDERWLNNGSSTKYSDIPVGQYTCWTSFTGVGASWYSDIDYISSSCEERKFTWTYSKKSPPLNDLQMNANGNSLNSSTLILKNK